MRRIKKRLLAWFMAVAMVFGVIHVSPSMVVEAKDGVHGITLGIPSWNSGRTEYTFPDVTVDMEGGTNQQKVFCISVSNSGCFEADLSALYYKLDISGVRTEGGEYADNSAVGKGAEYTPAAPQLSATDKEKLISITILGDITDDEIKGFISKLVFYRNDVPKDALQDVSVVSSSYDARKDGATALAVDGKLHFYKYVDWNNDVSKQYIGEDTPTTISRSSVSDDTTKWTWYTAYELSKKDKINVSDDESKYLKGYLATITSDIEQKFIFNKFGVEKDNLDGAQGAWIGGARTFTIDEKAAAVGADYDKDIITALYPKIDDDYAMDWKWMCGPEAHENDPQTRVFYRITDPGSNIPYGGSKNVITYAEWSGIEPNNFNVPIENDPYGQEYALQYGFVSDGGWNDWYPTYNESINNYQAPAGYLVEFSEYDINDDGDCDDPGEKGGEEVSEDITSITAQPHIVDAELNQDTFKFGEKITVKSVIGDLKTDAEGKADDELVGTSVPVYQWQVYNEETGEWDDASGEDAKTNSYTPKSSDVGKKLRVRITATDIPADNENEYVGKIYLDATGSDDQTNMITGTLVEGVDASVNGNYFMVAKKALNDSFGSSDIIELSKAIAIKEDGSEVPVKDISDNEINALKKTKVGSSSPITLINSSDETVSKVVKGFVYDNASDPTEKDGKISQIGSNNFSVRGNPEGDDKDAKFVIDNGKVTVITDGEIAERSYDDFTITNGLDDLNNAIKDNVAKTVKVDVYDTTTNLTTTISINIIPTTELALESALLDPYKNTVGIDGKPEHYIAGDTITLKSVTLNDGTVYEGDDLTNGNFTYQWQYSKNGNQGTDPDPWHNIDGAISSTLSAELTEKYANNKIQLVISVGDEGAVKGILKDPSKKIYVDGDGSAKEETHGTFIDRFVIDASDFIVTYKEGEGVNMSDNEAVEAAGANAELVNYNGTAKEKDVTDSDVENTLNKVTGPTDVEVTFYSDWETYKAKDKDDLTKIGKTVTAHVVDKAASKTDAGKKYEIGANNITISTTTAETILAKEIENQAKDLAEKAGVVVVADGSTVDEPVITIKYDEVKPLTAAAGKYDVTYIYTYAEEKTVEVTAKVIVEDPFFEVTPSNPDNPEKPKDGIDGPIKDTDKTKEEEKNYVYRIHLASDVDSVKLDPEIVHATITGLTKDEEAITPIPDDGVYTVEGVTPDKDVTVKYTVKSSLDDTIYTYTYIIDRAKSPSITTTANPNPTNPEDIPDVDNSKDPVEDEHGQLVKKITITVPSGQESVKVNATPDEGTKLDTTSYGDNGLIVTGKPDDATVTNNLDNASPSFTVDNLSTKTDTVVSVKALSDDERTSIIYEYTIVREKNDDATIKNVTPGEGSTDTEKYVELTTYDSELTWPIELNDPNATVDSIEKSSGKGTVTNPENKSSFTVSGLETDEPTVVKVKTIAENGVDTLTYIVKITRKDIEEVVDIDTTADPDPEKPDDKPRVEGDDDDPVIVGDELVKKITITVPSSQESVKVNATPKEGKLDLTYDGDGLKETQKPDDATITNNLNDTNPSFTVEKLSVDKDTIVSVKGVSDDGKNVVIYEYTIKREKNDNVNVITNTPDPTPEDPTDDPKIGDPEGPKEEEIDGVKEQVKDITITVPNKVTSLEVVPTPEDPSATFVTEGFGEEGLLVGNGTTIDKDKSSVTTKEAKFTVTDLKTDKNSMVSVKAQSADGKKTCVYRYTIVREKSDDATIKDVTPKPGATDDEKIVEITTDKTEYTWPIVLNDPTATVEKIEKSSGDGTVTNPDDKSSFTVSGLKPNEPTVVKVTTKAENGDKLTYVVKITNVPKEDPGTDPDPEDEVKIETTADPVPETLTEKPKVGGLDDDPVKVGDELVKRITITVPSAQNKVKVNTNPKEGKLDLTYDGDGLKETQKPDDAIVTNNLDDTNPSFTVENLSVDKDTIVSVKGVSDDGKTVIIYEYTIKRLKDDNVNVETGTTDPTPTDPTDDPKIEKPFGPKTETIGGNIEQVKDIKITVPHKVTELEVVPVPEDPSANFLTDFGDGGILVGDGTTVSDKNVTAKEAKFTVTDLTVDEDSVVSVKVKSADGTQTCVYRYTIVREKNNDATIKDVTPTPGTTDDEKVVEIPTDKTEYTWPIKLTDPNATVEKIEKVSGKGTLTVPDDKGSFTVTGLEPGETTVVNVTTKAENGDTLTYVVKITNNTPKKSNDPTPVGDPTPAPTPTATDGTAQPVAPQDIVYEKTNPQDKTEPADPSKQIPPTGALTINGVPVDQYTVSPDGTSLIISKDYLNTLPKGSYPAVLTYADGTTQPFNVTIVDYDETTLVKNPPLFSMYKEIVLKKKNTFTINLKGISDYAVVTSKITGKGKKATSVVKIKQQKNGDVLITPKKVGKSQVTCKIIQNGAEYKVVVDLKVLRQYKGTSKNYNLKPKGIVKTSGELPEFNVYKRIVKGKNTKIKFTKVATDAKVKFYVANKKEAKSLKIGKIKRKGKTATCTIKGKKKGWVHLTAEITQHGKTYYTRLLVRIDDGTWTKKQIKKYLK